jgi:tripartite ATP-independent transporter DctP family solute receptor
MIARRAVLAGALAGACAPQAEMTRVLTAADVHRPDYPTVVAVRWIGDALERETQGRLRLRQYPSGQLGAEDDTIGMARFGALDFARINAAALNNRVPQTRALCLPFVIRSVAHLHAVVDSEIGAAIRSAFAGTGLVALAIYDAGARCIYNVRRDIRTPADLRGLKVRAPQSDVFLHMVAAMGANPTPLPVNGVFQALSTHLIDGAENNWPTYDSARHLEMARHWSNTEHSYAPEFLVMSQARYDALAPNDRDLVRALALQSVGPMRTHWAELNAESRARALGAGIVVTEPDREAFRAAVAGFVAEESRNADIAALLSRIQAMAA